MYLSEFKGDLNELLGEYQQLLIRIQRYKSDRLRRKNIRQVCKHLNEFLEEYATLFGDCADEIAPSNDLVQTKPVISSEIVTQTVIASELITQDIDQNDTLPEAKHVNAFMLEANSIQPFYNEPDFNTSQCCHIS